MKRIRYLAMIMVALLMGSAASYGQDDFNPSSPSEPGANGQLYQSRVVLLRNIEDAGSVSGAGKYYINQSVNVYAYVNSGYTFDNWTDTKGNILSTDRSYTFTNSDKADTLIANYSFVPGNPNEPSEPSTTLRYRLLLQPTEGLTVSGSGRYLKGTSVYCRAYVEEGYAFLGWYKKDGTLVSTGTGFNYTMPVGGDTLTAKCEFDPNSVDEPGDPILKHNLTVTCSDGGYWTGESAKRILEGTSFYLSAHKEDGYDFKGWYLNGELYTTLSSFSYTMGKEDLNFYACFEFNPDSPTEPAMPAISQYSYYLPTVNGKPGDTVKYSINLVNTEQVKDMDIRLTFPAGVVISPTDYVLSDKATGYTVTVTPAVDDISIIEEGAQLWDFSFVGGTTEPATQALLTFNVFLPDILPTGYSHQVKINQISMTMEDGTAVTAHTRNGRLGVFKLGDANGDNDVNIVDISNTVKVVNGGSSEDLIPEVMDTNEDGVTDADDVSGMATIANDQNAGNTYEGTALTGTFSSSDNLNHAIQVKVNNSEKYVAFQMDIKLPAGVTYQSLIPSEARMPAASSFITNCQVINEEENIVRILAYNMSNTTLSGKSSDPLFTLNLLSAEEKAADTLSVVFSKVIFVRESDLAGVIPAEPGAEYILGDANNSGEVNVADITAVVSHIYGQTPVNFNTDAADVNESGEINVADITGIVSIIYGGTSNEAKGNVTTTENIQTILSIPAVSMNAGGSVCIPLSLTNAENLSSYQFDLTLPGGIKAEYVETMSDAHECIGRYVSDNIYRIMCYSRYNDKFMASAPVGYLTLSADGVDDGSYNLGITSAVVSCRGEETKPVVQNSKLIIGNADATAIKDINASDGEQVVTVTALSGMRYRIDKSRLNSLHKGIYIVNGKKLMIQ